MSLLLAPISCRATRLDGPCADSQDCVQSEGKLYLIFEFVDRDLKKYMEATQGMLDPMLVKVGNI